jgi:hypothetical protein
MPFSKALMVFSLAVVTLVIVTMNGGIIWQDDA